MTKAKLPATTELVIEVLLGVARAHPLARPHPEPTALFLGLGNSALQFELL